MTSPPTEAWITVGSVMHSGVVTCPPDATLRTVAGILAANRIHAVVVSPDEAAPRAVVTDRDVVFGHARGDLDRPDHHRPSRPRPATGIRGHVPARNDAHRRHRPRRRKAHRNSLEPRHRERRRREVAQLIPVQQTWPSTWEEPENDWPTITAGPPSLRMTAIRSPAVSTWL